MEKDGTTWTEWFPAEVLTVDRRTYLMCLRHLGQQFEDEFKIKATNLLVGNKNKRAKSPKEPAAEKTIMSTTKLILEVTPKPSFDESLIFSEGNIVVFKQHGEVLDAEALQIKANREQMLRDIIGLDHFSASKTIREARIEFSKEEEQGAKDWVDKKVYEKTADPSMVFENSRSCEYIPHTSYKGGCTLYTMTNAIGCPWVTTMK